MLEKVKTFRQKDGAIMTKGQGLPTVVVVNQFALPRSQGGGTRHADIFGNVDDYDTVIFAGDRNYTTQLRYTTDDSRFRLLRVPASDGSGIRRMVGWSVFTVGAVFASLRVRRVAAVYASTPHLLAPLAGWFTAKLRGVPMILEVRDLWPDTFATAGAMSMTSPAYRILKAIEKFLYRNADSIVVVAEGWEEHFRSHGADMSNYQVVPNGTEVREFPVDADRDEIRVRHGLSGVTAVYAGAHGYANGLDLVVDAAAQNTDVNFLLIGDGPEKVRLRDLVERRGLENVEFRDSMPKSELVELLVGCDIGVHCLRAYDALDQGMSPNKIFDYMAAQLPVVSNAGNSARAILGDAQDFGVPTNEGGLAEAIRVVVSCSDGERESMGRLGRNFVQENYSRQAAGESIRELLRKVER